MKSLAETITTHPDLSTLLAALTAADLLTTLSSSNSFTVLAPTNKAFAKIAEGDLKTLLADKPRLTTLLQTHLSKGKKMSEEIKTMKTLMTVAEKALSVDALPSLALGGSLVVGKEIECSNGVIYLLDTVLS